MAERVTISAHNRARVESGDVAIIFVVPGKPQSRQRARRGKGGRWYTPAATRRSQLLIAWHVTRARLEMGMRDPGITSQPVRVEIVAYMPDRRVRDVDGVAANVLDALKKCGAISDDRWTVVGEVNARAELDRDNPRVEVTVRRVA